MTITNEPDFPFRFASLFCGCGGFDLGFVQSGFNCIAAYDIDSVAIETHQKNIFPGSEIRDLSEGSVDFAQLKDIDILVAGPPCQGFSTAGKRRVDDPRNHLLLSAGQFVLTIQPRVLVLENVPGVTSGEHRKYWEQLKFLLKEDGYHTTDFLINVQEIGLPQMRKRMILVAWKTEIPWVTPEFSGEKISLQEALSNINGAQNHDLRHVTPGSDLYLIVHRIKPGQKLSNVRGGPRSVHTWDIPEVYGDTNGVERTVLTSLLRLRRRLRLRDKGDADPVLASDLSKDVGFSTIRILEGLVKKGYVRKTGNRYDLCHAFNGKFRRLRWDKPSYTVDTRFTDFRYFLHPDENRGFSVREAARIQGFPDTFVFTGNEKEQARLVGNAVPPPLGRWVALGVRKMLTRR